MTISLVATDMDGTLLDGAGRVPADFAPWVLAHPEVRTVIASGRQVYTLQEQFAEIADHLIFVADNGALVLAPATSEEEGKYAKPSEARGECAELLEGQGGCAKPSEARGECAAPLEAQGACPAPSGPQDAGATTSDAQDERDKPKAGRNANQQCSAPSVLAARVPEPRVDRHTILHKDVMDPAAVAHCIGLFTGVPGCSLVICGVESAYVLNTASKVAQDNVAMYYAHRQFVGDLGLAWEQDEVIKIAAFFENDGAWRYLKGVPGLPAGLKSVVSSTHWLDIANESVNKGAAIRAIQARYGIAPDACMAFGDYLNDLELLEACGESYCMANGVDEVKAVARHIAPANTEDGVMTVLRAI